MPFAPFSTPRASTLPPSKLGIASSPLFGTNGFNLDVEVSLHLTGRIEVSTNLQNWTMLTNFVGSNSVLHFFDAAATNSHRRFYRAVAP